MARNGRGESNKKNSSSNCVQYCGVSEFTSPNENHAYLPNWMLSNLGLNKKGGSIIEIEYQFNMPKVIFFNFLHPRIFATFFWCVIKGHVLSFTTEIW